MLNQIQETFSFNTILPGINTRVECLKTMERLKYDPVTRHSSRDPHDPWFGIEQEYVVTRSDNFPVSYEPKDNDYATLSEYPKGCLIYMYILCSAYTLLSQITKFYKILVVCFYKLIT